MGTLKSVASQSDAQWPRDPEVCPASDVRAVLWSAEPSTRVVNDSIVSQSVRWCQDMFKMCRQDLEM